MFKHVTITVALLFGAGLLVGCTPSPEKVCKKVDELEEKEAESKKKDKDIDPKLQKLIDSMKAKWKEACPKAFASLKESSPDVYKCAAKCIMKAKEGEDIKKCDDECDGFKDAMKKAMKKAASDDDKADDSDKKKKKAADDEESDKKKDSDDDSDKKKKKKAADDE
jgi:hypothetical protein